jgi:dTDP-glucose 4,6-dehydratase
MKGLLITGGAGFIGSNFVRHWLRQYPVSRVVILDSRMPTEKLQHAEQATCRFVHGSIRNQQLVEQLLRNAQLDTIVHLAAEHCSEHSSNRPTDILDTNILGTQSVLEAARQVWLEEHSVEHHCFHYVSSGEAYGILGSGDLPFAEQAPYCPRSLYAASKAAAEHLAGAYHHTYGLTVTTSRCGATYGPYQAIERVIPSIIAGILHGRSLPIDGHGICEWLHVDDLCAAVELILMKGIPGASYNIGGNAECQTLVLARRLCEIADRLFRRDGSLARKFPRCPAAFAHSTDSLICLLPGKHPHTLRYAVDSSRIAGELGFRPRTGLEAGLRSTFEWYTHNDSWWRRTTHASQQSWIRGAHSATEFTTADAETFLSAHCLR